MTGGWAKARVLWMWVAIAVVSGLASLAGYGLFQNSSPDTVGFVLAFAAGAILTMLANTMMPEAFEHGGKSPASSPPWASPSPTGSTHSAETTERTGHGTSTQPQRRRR